jgi:hypothetical protein
VFILPKELDLLVKAIGEIARTSGFVFGSGSRA